MSMKHVEKMIMEAPEVEKWWAINKKSIKRTWTLSNVVGNLWLNGSVLSVLAGGVLEILEMQKFTYAAPVPSSSVIVPLSVFCCLMVVSGWRKRRVLQRKYKHATEQWGLDPFNDQTLTNEQREEIVAQLNEVIADQQKVNGSINIDQHIQNLQHLDLPDSWWHQLNQQIVSAKDDLSKKVEVAQPSLDDVIVSTTRKDGTTSHVMRL